MASVTRKTLPGVAYHSDETYAVDKERVFYRNWVYVGRAERVARPGDWLRIEIADESILVVRGKDEEIRAFYNVCRHRGSRICDDEQGSVRTHLRCPYHAWGYALDGTLVTTPMVDK
jgi:Rieske 2Fe-2S family protein